MSGRLEIASNQLGELSGAIQMRHGEEVWVVIYEIQQSGFVRQGFLQPAQLVERKRSAPVGGLELRRGGIRLDHRGERPDSLLVAALVEWLGSIVQIDDVGEGAAACDGETSMRATENVPSIRRIVDLPSTT
jgi:hypothetical protein